eukprot:symbB.v1.2.023449.t3/scaffold2139.1/size165116/3
MSRAEMMIFRLRRLGIWQWVVLPWLSTLLLVALPELAQASTLSGIAHVPSVDTNTGIPYQAPLIEPLNRLGVQEDTAAKNLSQFVHIGCFIASMAITRDAEQDTHFDPSACVEVCKARYPNNAPKEIVAAVHGPRCGCHVGTLPETFTEVDSSYCTYPCKFYENPICGGPPSFWGVFVQFDFQAYSSHGAYDPWRKIWYTVVVVREATIIGQEAWNPDLQLEPERYFLHAASAMCDALKAEKHQAESPESFRDRMLQVQEEFPERKHDFGDASAAERVFALWHQQRNAPQLFEGVEAMLQRLKRAKWKVGTLTDGNADPLTMTALKDIIDFHVNSVEAGAPKPDRRMFQLCEAKSGCAAEELVSWW